MLKPGGTVVLDDLYPALEYWPEEMGPRDQYGRSVTEARAYWLQHPELFVTEIRIEPRVGTILGTRKARRPEA